MKLIPVLIISLALILPACGARTPSQAKTANVAKKFFNKYGKKYKDTEFGTRVNQVEVKEVRELQKNVATSFILIKLKDGTEVPVISTLIRKPLSGWKITSWEIAQQ